MPRLRKLALNNTVIFLTTSVEEGIMFPPNPLINELMLGCFAKAQEHHDLEVCHYTLEGTHLHMILVVRNPDDVRGFMERFKTESAHVINRLLGRQKRTVWCEGYDSPTVISPDKVIEKIVYIYRNPTKDNLVDTIDRYPGLNSWREFMHGKTTYKTRYIPRSAVGKISDKVMDLDDYRREARRLSYKRRKISFRISPNGWMRCFKITNSKEIKEINEKIINRVYQEEEESRGKREALGKRPMGLMKLTLTPVGTAYQPEREGKRSLCIGDNDQDRIDFIAFAKSLFEKGRETLEQWRKGNYALMYPVGIYPPSLPRTGELLANCYR
jgi:REP element-mobilizing transposase RayT